MLYLAYRPAHARRCDHVVPSLGAGWLLARQTGLDLATASLGMVAGGSAAIVGVAEDHADDRCPPRPSFRRDGEGAARINGGPRPSTVSTASTRRPPDSGPWLRPTFTNYELRVHHRFSTDGTWDKVLTALQAQADARGDTDWLTIARDRATGGHDRAPSRRSPHAQEEDLAGAINRGDLPGPTRLVSLGHSNGCGDIPVRSRPKIVNHVTRSDDRVSVRSIHPNADAYPRHADGWITSKQESR